jgi:hypothetical protein
MQEALTYVISLYGALLIPFSKPDFGPKLATALLVLGLLVILVFLGVAVPQSFRLRAALSAIRGRLKNETETEKRITFQTNYDVIDAALLSNKTISAVWQEFRKTLRRDQQGTILGSERPNNFFNPRSLLVQYDFVRTLPNYFVGLGLLGTFIGLIAALTFATQSLTKAVDPAQIKAALNDLLTTAAAKFYISAAGLVASLVLSLLIRLMLKRLHSGVHEFNGALQERLHFITEQSITEKQLSIQQQSLTELKLFNTNIAMKIGDAVRTAVEASNDNLTKKLSEIADSFARLIDASGEGAGKAVEHVKYRTIRARRGRKLLCIYDRYYGRDGFRIHHFAHVFRLSDSEYKRSRGLSPSLPRHIGGARQLAKYGPCSEISRQ